MNTWLSRVSLDYDFGARHRCCECCKDADHFNAASLQLLTEGLPKTAVVYVPTFEPDRRTQ